MKTLLKISLLFIVLFTVGCSKDDEDTGDLELYVGSWSGTFSGSDSGTFLVTIYIDGEVSGTAFSNNLKQNIPLNGEIDESGNFDAVLGVSDSGASFTGKFTETKASGTWKNPPLNFSGTWNGVKQ